MAGNSSSFALTPFGSGTPITATAPPSELAQRAAYISPATRDYVLDSSGELERMPAVRQQFLLALLTEKGSCANDHEAGIEMPEKIDENISATMRGAVERACAHITSAGRAVLLDVTTKETMLGVTTTVQYIDLTTGENDSVSF